MIITDEIMEGAQVLADAADEIMTAADVAMIARGHTDPAETVGALLAAAWCRHKELAPNDPMPFAEMVRHLADRVEAMARPN